MDARKVIGELLTLLERREAELMEWGFFEVSHSAGDIASLFSESSEWGDAFRDLLEDRSEELLIDDLAAAHILHRVSGTYPPAYRSRFAESTRLFARLRQRFKADDWLTAPELVSEVRLHLSARRIPVRNVPVSAVWEQLRGAAWKSDLQRTALVALCGSEGAELPLAPFQVRAAARILQFYRGSPEPTGTVVTAGTGGGKTKSFYIPAFLGIVADIAADARHSTKVLSIYPRNVLLTDQFSEAADQARLVNEACSHTLTRKISVGALIGDVPLTANFEHDKRNEHSLKRWEHIPDLRAWSPPHIRHPETGHPLLWLDQDRLAGRTTLRESTPTQRIVFPDGLLVLTREQLLSRPPDIFLTSIEMINKEVSSEIGRALLGFGKGVSSLRLLLLDEIHTYEGITGAQVPWILRRLTFWTRASSARRSGPHFVGLSATLQDACTHLATLCGINENAIAEVCPEDTADEIDLSGNEYNVVLKSQSGNGTSVLSTSIQAVMLGARLLTPTGAGAPPKDQISGNYYFGRKLFGFTDNLDVVNRWLPNFLHAERTLGLAALRASRPGDQPMDQAGQTWRLAESIGHSLSRPLSVARTSSQDPGVDARADVVLATSALEVGFDDPQVGMVLQHKAPRSAASFLQRKGRAGRRPGSRPWAVVVLSSHGRDRWAFRDSERLFSPSLARLALPVLNPYVLRIQATWFLVDWIAKRVGEGVPNLYLSRADYANPSANQVVASLIEDPAQRDLFTRDLVNWLTQGGASVHVADPVVLAHDVLWAAPRSVLRNVVPDLWKELSFRFECRTTEKPRLLPKYIPSNTWDVLDSQETELITAGAEVVSMDAAVALREAPPGRASRRHVVDVKAPSRWLECSQLLISDPAPTHIDVAQLFVANIELDASSEVRVFQPLQLSLIGLPTTVKSSSNAFWKWQIEARRIGNSEEVDFHIGAAMSTFCESSCLWVHRNQSRVRILRFAEECSFEIHLDGNVTRRGSFRVGVSDPTGQVAPAAVGYARSVDALELRIRPDLLAGDVTLPESIVRDLRPVFFRYLANQSPVLKRHASTFGIQLLCTSALGVLAATALTHDVSLQDAWPRISDRREAARKVLQTILSAQMGEDDHDEGRRTTETLELWANEEVVNELALLCPVLWKPLDGAFSAWLKETCLETLRATIENAVSSILPEASDGDLNVDLISEAGRHSILISESVAGGVGVIERLRAEISAHPGLLDIAVRDALENCRNEQLILAVGEATHAACVAESAMAAVFAQVRGATAYSELNAAKLALISELDLAGFRHDKEAVVALVGKSLMPGSDERTDKWVHFLWKARERVSGRLGLALDVRLFCYWLLTVPSVRRRMATMVSSITRSKATPSQLFNALVRLTLERCQDTCPECLGAARDLEGITASRRVARTWLQLDTVDRIVEVGDDQRWIEEFDSALKECIRIRLRYDQQRRRDVALFLAARLAQEVDRGFLASSFHIAATRRAGHRWETDLQVDVSEAA